MATIGKYGKVEFSKDDIQFIKDNFQSMTNEEIALRLCVKKTILRMTAYSMGLQRMTLEYWPQGAVDYLVNNYKVMGNLEIAEHLNEHFPRNKKWCTHHIDKKIGYLKLQRSKKDLLNITERNRQRGSYGTPNPKKKVKELRTFITFKNNKYELLPGQTKEELFELILQGNIGPINDKENDTTI